MGVAPEVIEDFLRGAERLFGIDHPLLFAQRTKLFFPWLLVGK